MKRSSNTPQNPIQMHLKPARRLVPRFISAAACAALISGLAACNNDGQKAASTNQDYWYAYPRDNGDGVARPATTKSQGDPTNDMPNTPAPRRQTGAAPPARTGSVFC